MKDTGINEVYYCSEEDLAKTKTRKKFVKDFLEYSPDTFFDKEGNRKQGTGGTWRSVTDLLAIVRSRFPKTSLKALIRILDELNKEDLAHLRYCSTVEKFVVVHTESHKKGTPFMTDYTIQYHANKRGKDNLSALDIQAMRNITRKEKNQNRDNFLRNSFTDSYMKSRESKDSIDINIYVDRNTVSRDGSLSDDL